MRINRVENPIVNDFFSVEGSALAADLKLEFLTSAGPVSVVPKLVRPHLALVDRLPATVPVGHVELRAVSATAGVSNSLLLNVAPGPPAVVRLLAPGESKPAPFTLVFVANPAILNPATGAVGSDPILTDRPGYHSVVSHALNELFLGTEDLLRRTGFESRVRIVSLFDAIRPATIGNALAAEVPASIMMETRRDELAPFLASHHLVADLVFVIHASPTHSRASAWFTTDDEARPSAAFSYDGNVCQHGQFARIPGSVAIPVNVPRNAPIILHEFCHAASECKQGKVVDLYIDRHAVDLGFLINKKFRAAAGDPIPAVFADYNGVRFDADLAGPHAAYASSWKSYHPGRTDPAWPNLMDDYWAASSPCRCCLDPLTRTYLRDRLETKLAR